MKKLLIFFDNQTFKLNSLVINCIKRWIVYKIINNYLEYNEIYIYKTYPNFVEKKIKLNNDNKEENICDILTWINNIIYKTYNNYPTICVKNIVDKIKSIDDENYEIIVITSLTLREKESFMKDNIKYITDIIKKYNINYINISNDNNVIYNLFGTLEPIKENHIDINCLKTENIDIYKIINIGDKNDINNKNYEKNIIDLNMSNIKSVNLFEYIKILYWIESCILTNISSNNKNTEFNSIASSILKDIKIIGNEYQNNKNNQNCQIVNIVKSYTNFVLDIISRQNELVIKFPIDKLTPELDASYIKYILEFYSIIYPKIYNNNLIQLNSKNQKNKQKKISNITSEIKLKDIKPINILSNDISEEFLKSTLTLTNWIDEYENANPFGFLINYNPNKLSYKGILDLGSSILKTYPNMVVNNITTNFVPLYDYYQIVLFDYENNKNDNEDNNEEKNDDINDLNNKKNFFNIKNFNIPDNINGDGNVMLPLYINKQHWELTKSLWSYHMTFVNNCFEQEYDKKMDNIYFLSILKLFGDLKNINANSNSKSITRLFGYMLRTCIQILIDNKFLHSIKGVYSKYLDSVMESESLDKNSIFADWVIRVIQLIISNAITDQELKVDLDKITNLIFKKYIIANYKMDFWDKINNPKISETEKKNELSILKNDVLQGNICWLFLNFDLRIFNKIVKSIYAINGFNQFIKQIDKTNGCLRDTNETNETNILTIKALENIFETHCGTQFNINDYPVDISQYCSEYKLDKIDIGVEKLKNEEQQNNNNWDNFVGNQVWDNFAPAWN